MAYATAPGVVDLLMRPERGRTTASAYYLGSEVPLTRPHRVGEALNVEAWQAVIGFADPRFVKVSTPPEDAENNGQNAASDPVSLRLGSQRWRDRACHARGARRRRRRNAGFSAHRELECVRRIYEPIGASCSRLDYDGG